jgi:glutamate dehydrogenase (NAD(P)+)
VADREVPSKLRDQFVHGASELDLVRSGLDDTMRSAFADIRDAMKRNPDIHDYRTAAFVIAIRKLAQSYYDLGLADVGE